jgi:hypothetical protein
METPETSGSFEEGIRIAEEQLLKPCGKPGRAIYSGPPAEPRRQRWLSGTDLKCGDIFVPKKGIQKGIPQRVLCESHSTDLVLLVFFAPRPRAPV